MALCSALTKQNLASVLSFTNGGMFAVRRQSTLLSCKAVHLLMWTSAVLGASAFSGSLLRFSDTGTFKILQLTDLHYGGSAADDSLADQLQQLLLAVEAPDLVVFSGDMVSGYLWNESAAPNWFLAR